MRTALSAWVVACLLAGALPAPGQEPPPRQEVAPQAPGTPPEEPAPAEAQPAAADERLHTPGGALAVFMSSRDYRTLRELKSVMTPALKAIYDKDSVPFNGKQGVRLAAFDFREPAPNPSAKKITIAVKSLWDDQGEAVELRAEIAGLERDESGLWRVARLQKGTVEPLRYKDAVPGVTALRLILRAWQRRDLEGAKSSMSEAFKQRLAGKDEGLAAVFIGDPSLRRAAFRILELKPRSSSSAVARVRLVETTPGRPSSLEGAPKSLGLVKRGSRWLLDDWK